MAAYQQETQTMTDNRVTPKTDGELVNLLTEALRPQGWSDIVRLSATMYVPQRTIAECTAVITKKTNDMAMSNALGMKPVGLNALERLALELLADSANIKLTR